MNLSCFCEQDSGEKTGVGVALRAQVLPVCVSARRQVRCHESGIKGLSVHDSISAEHTRRSCFSIHSAQLWDSFFPPFMSLISLLVGPSTSYCWCIYIYMLAKIIYSRKLNIKIQRKYNARDSEVIKLLYARWTTWCCVVALCPEHTYQSCWLTINLNTSGNWLKFSV